ncbi:TetR/AcrR family transcriptional regulator [Kineosporia succinea]|uniref:AcrR family transcriptional regulator n=1 Tax=Kineosporia succinea TaxID=84632 RepID=A0ABT9PAM4_9ACTN|nr:TetR family transcriptional regulator [Kineosporia succinea]MDP9829748.1 AcrR family transcriptional regulator [Kineosporia succinea]
MTSGRLVERKQQQARQRIVRAAAELFAAHGFDGVSVSDIAERAEVGRTTFFRHFGDKQEVVFAHERELLGSLDADAVRATPGGTRTAADALLALQPFVVRLGTLVASDPDEYRSHTRLVAGSPELQARSAAKAQLIAQRLTALLVEKGWESDVATFAGHVAIACFATARDICGDAPEALAEATRTAFDRALALGTSSAQ